MAAHQNRALLVVDLQVAYVAEAAGGEELLATLTGLRERAAAAGAPVFWIQHREPGFGPGDPGWEPAIPPGDTDRVVVKHSPDGFLATDLGVGLRDAGVGAVVVGGYSSEFCVDATVRSALGHGFDVVVASDGHATARDGAVLTARQVVDHHNAVFAALAYPGRTCEVLAAHRISFAPGDGRTS